LVQVVSTKANRLDEHSVAQADILYVEAARMNQSNPLDNGSLVIRKCKSGLSTSVGLQRFLICVANALQNEAMKLAEPIQSEIQH